MSVLVNLMHYIMLKSMYCFKSWLRSTDLGVSWVFYCPNFGLFLLYSVFNKCSIYTFHEKDDVFSRLMTQCSAHHRRIIIVLSCPPNSRGKDRSALCMRN